MFPNNNKKIGCSSLRGGIRCIRCMHLYTYIRMNYTSLGFILVLMGIYMHQKCIVFSLSLGLDSDKHYTCYHSSP